MLFLSAGMMILFGIIQVSVNAKQQAMTELNVQAVSRTEARNMAASGLNRAMATLAADTDWRGPATYTFGAWSVVVTVEDSDDDGTLGPLELRLTAVTQTENGPITSIALLNRGAGTPIPAPDAAMGIFTPNLNLSVSGSAFLISGNDTNPDGSAGLEGALSGIAVNSLAAYNEILASLNATQQSRVQGDGGTPSLELDPTMDADALEAFYEQVRDNATHVYDAGYVASGEASLGTPDNPRITLVRSGSLEVRNATGAGIIIIEEGASLDCRGNLDNFQGIILVRGDADMTRGNIHIYGAMMFGGDNPALQIDIDFRGNVNVVYSSSVVNSVQEFVNETVGGANYSVVSIYD